MAGEADLARCLVDELGREARIRPVFDEGELWCWNGDYWRVISDVELKQRLQRHHRKGFKVGRLMMLGAVEVIKVLCASPGFFNQARPCISLEGGTAVPINGVVRPMKPDPGLRCRFHLPVKLEAKGTPRAFIGFLNDVWEPDEDRDQKRTLIGEFIGSALLGASTSFEQALLCWGGTGMNGKSVLLSSLERLFPPSTVCAVPPQRWESEYYAAELMGSRLNVVAELTRQSALGGAAFKSIVSGDTITARPIRREPMSFRPIAGHIFATNPLPPTHDTSEAFWRRWQVLGFNRRFDGSANKADLINAITADQAAIVSWALRLAAEALAKGRYTTPPSSAAALAQWKGQADQVFAFVSDRCAKLGRSSLAELYLTYRAWALSTGHNRLSMSSFRERLANLGHELVDGRVGLTAKPLEATTIDPKIARSR